MGKNETKNQQPKDKSKNVKNNSTVGANDLDPAIQKKIGKWLKDRLKGRRTLTTEIMGGLFGLAAKLVAQNLAEDELREKVFAEYAVAEVVGVHQDKFESGKMDIGDIVIDVLFEGNADIVLSDGTEKPVSYSEICKHENLPISARTLNKYTRAAALKRLFEESGHKFTDLSPSHYEELAVLKNSSDRLSLAKKANKDKSSVRELRKAVEKKRKERGEITEAPNVKLAKALNKANNIDLDKELAEYAQDKDAVKNELSGKKLYREQREAKKALNRMKTYVKVIEAYVANLDELVEDDQHDEDLDDLFDDDSGDDSDATP